MKSKIKKLRQEGLNYTQISKKLSIPLSTIAYIIDKNFPELKVNNKRKYSAEEKEGVLKLHRQGLGYKRISKITGIPRSTVASWCTIL